MIEAPERPAEQTVSPYKGLMPYSDGDAPFFFGRDRERELIIANVLASRLTLLYGESGVGKSSLLRAGVVHRLRERAQADLARRGAPDQLVVEFSSWRDDPLAGLQAAIASSVALVMGPGEVAAPAPSDRLDETLLRWTDRVDAELVIIFDQFEEYFLYHGQEDGAGTFFAEFPRAVNRPDLPASFLISIREDALAKLDRFKGRIPNLFDNYLRIEHLDRIAARSAVEAPLEELNRRHPDAPALSIEPELVAAVLDEVRTGEVVIGQAGSGVVGAGPAGGHQADRIETPFLQLVMLRLWDEEVGSGSRTLRLATLSRLGGARRIVRTHLDGAMASFPSDQQEVAARAFRYLVTPGGAKIAHTALDLAEYAGVPEATLVTVLERLSGGDVRILRTVPPPLGETAPRYEIFHDVLGPAILDWRVRYDHAREQAEAQRRLEREKLDAEERARRARRGTNRALAIAGVAVVFAVGVAILALWALDQKNEAQQARTETAQEQQLGRSRALARRALAMLELSPQLSIRLSLEAVRVSRTDEAVDALRQSISASRVRQVLLGHTDQVFTVEYDPAGTRIVTAGADRTAIVWDAGTGELAHRLEGHTDQINAAEFSPDGRKVVTASSDETAIVWDLDAGTHVVLEGHTDWVRKAHFSPDGRFVVTASQDSSARVWDASTGTQLAELPAAGVTWYAMDAEFSPDGRSLVTASGDNTVKLWSWRRERSSWAFTMPNVVHTASFSPDGSQVLAASTDGDVKLLDAATGNQLADNPGYGRAVARYSPDGKYVVAAGGILSTALSATDLSFVGFPGRHTDFVNTAAISLEDSYIVSAGVDGMIHVWDLQTGGQLLELRNGNPVNDVDIDPKDSSRLASVGSDGTVRIWDLSTGVELRGHNNWVLGASFSSDGQLAATSGYDGTVRLWDPKTGLEREDQQLAVGRESWGAVFKPKSHELLSADGGGGVKLWNADTGALVKEFLDSELPSPNGFYWSANAATFSPDGKLVAVAGLEGSGGRAAVAKVWEVASGRLLTTFPKEHGAEATGRSLPGHTRYITGIAIDPTSTRVLTVSYDETAQIWDARTGELLSRIRARSILLGAAFSPDGRRIATAGQDGAVRVYQVDSESPPMVIQGPAGEVTSVAFSPDGSAIVTGGSDGTTRVSDAGAGHLLAVMPQHAGPVNVVTFSPDGKLIMSGAKDFTAKIYPCETCLPPAALVELARSHQTPLMVDERATLCSILNSLPGPKPAAGPGSQFAEAGC